MNLATTIALVSSSTDPKAFGTGFVVHHDDDWSYLVTCAHVLRDIEAKQTDATRILVNSLAAKVVAQGEIDAIDLAVLRVPRLFDREPLPLGRLASGTGEGTAIRVAGQCSRNAKAARVAEWLDGQLQKEIGLTSQQHSVRGWRIAFQGSDRVQPGYSGGPVLVDGRVVAVAAMQLDKEGSEAIAISIEALSLIWTCHALKFSKVSGKPPEPPAETAPNPPESPTPTGERNQQGIIFNDRATGQFGNVTQNFGNATYNFGAPPVPTNSPTQKTPGAPWDSQRKKQLRKALMSVYRNYQALALFAREEFNNVHLPAVTGQTDITTACFELIEWAEAKGRLDELHAAFLRENLGRDFSI